MNLTWHIVKKDLRAQKWPLLLWSSIIVAKLGVGVALLTAQATTNLDWLATSFSRMAVLAQVLAGLEGVSFVLVAAVIQEDLLVGTTAFWLTRPISGARLLRAKLLGIAVMFGVVPVLITLPWWLGCGYGAREIAWAAGELLVVQAAFALAGLLWATVTDGFARFLMWTLVTLFAFPSIAAMIGLHISTNLTVKPTPDLMLTRTCIALAIAVTAILAVTIHQFLTRHTWRSVAMILSAAGLIIITALWWPWDWQLNSKFGVFRMRILVPERSMISPEPAGLKFNAQAPTVVPTSAADRHIQMNVDVDGLPAGRALFPFMSDYSLRWANGALEGGASQVRNTMRFIPDDLDGMSTDASSPANRQQLRFELYFAASRFEHVLADPPVFTSRIFLRSMKSVGREKIPLQAGEWLRLGANSERVAGVETGVGQQMTAIVRSTPATWMDAPSYLTNQAFSWRIYTQYRLINRTRNEGARGIQFNAVSARIATVLINFSLVSYDAPNGEAHTKASRAAQMAWMRDAELYRETYVEESRFIHEIKVDPLVLMKP